jgi:hypothetical protein
MSTQTQTIAGAPLATPPPATAGFQASDRLRECASKLREHIRGPLASHWLKDNQTLVESHIADLRHTLRPSFLRRLHQTSEGEPRIYRIVTGWLANAPGVIDNDALLPFAETLRETQALNIDELWASDAEVVHRGTALREFGERAAGGRLRTHFVGARSNFLEGFR